MNRFAKIGIVTFLLILLFNLFLKKTFAVVATTLSNLSQAISSDLFTLTATISGATTGTNYLRIDLYKDQTTNYFGETFNGSYWYTGSDHTQFLPITIQSGTVWTGTIQGKVGNPSSLDYDGTGVYKLRLRRYTSSGSYTSSEANVNAVVVNIAVPTFTPTPSPTLIPTPTSIPTQTPSSTPSPAPTKIPTLTPVPSKVITPSIKVEPTALEIEDEKTIDTLGEATVSGEIAPSPEKTKVSDIKNSKWPQILMITGGLILIVCGILSYWIFYQKKDFLWFKQQ